MVFESVARLNAVEPSKVGQSDSWSNPETKSSGTSTILRMFRSGGMACHLVRHHIVAGRPPPRDYRLTWCRTSERRMEDQELTQPRGGSLFWRNSPVRGCFGFHHGAGAE
jgi:hypothetical protein